MLDEPNIALWWNFGPRQDNRKGSRFDHHFTALLLHAVTPLLPFSLSLAFFFFFFFLVFVFSLSFAIVLERAPESHSAGSVCHLRRRRPRCAVKRLVRFGARCAILLDSQDPCFLDGDFPKEPPIQAESAVSVKCRKMVNTSVEAAPRSPKCPCFRALARVATILSFPLERFAASRSEKGPKRRPV